MNFAFCSTSSVLSYPTDTGLMRFPYGYPLPVDDSREVHRQSKDFIKLLPHRDGRRVVASCHLVPGHLEGLSSDTGGRRPLEEPRKKLDFDFVRTLLIDNYDSYTYNIYQELSTVNGVPPVVIRNDEWTWEQAYHYIYEEFGFDNIVISPGPGSPACPADIGICLRLLLECGDIPVLGVCLGHQVFIFTRALCYAHGARVVHAPEPIHGRLSGIEHDGNKLFSNIPSGRNSNFKVVRYHSLVVDTMSLPKKLIPIAWTSSDDTGSFFDKNKLGVAIKGIGSTSGNESTASPLGNLGNERYSPSHHFEGRQKRDILMGIKHSALPHYGVQFHPESIATSYGRQIFKNFRDITEDYWRICKPPSVNRRKINDTVHTQAPGGVQLFRELSQTKSVANVCSYQGNPGTSGSLFAGKGDKLGSFNPVDLGICDKFVRLNWRKFDGLAHQVGGAGNIFCELFGQNGADNTFWLDSSSTEKARARFSFMGGKGGSLWKQVTFRLSNQSKVATKGGGHLLIENAQGSTESTFLEEGFFDFLNKELSSFHYHKKDFEGLPFDFHGGYVGCFGYDLKVECGVAFNRHKSKAPDACFFFADNLLVIDHYLDDIYILSIHEEGTAETSFLDDIEQKLISMRGSATRNWKDQTVPAMGSSPCKASFPPEKSREQYIKDVQSCLNYIKDGESYELCLTTQNRQTIGNIDALGLYLHLRQRNPAPYAAFLNFSKENLCLCSSSPERFLRLDRNGVLEAKPIKGTIARGSTPKEDEKLKLQLKFSEKDQAENLMIVDLLRNDLGRVCEPGSVHVPNLMDVESYATVHTMVSTIRGLKRSDISPVECVRAAFPGGSMTGAPKLRSMEILDSLESCSRGLYSGSIGFFSYTGAFDLNIVIRTVVIHEGEASIGAGGAIVALSNLEDEFEEMILKTRAPAKAVMEFSGQ